MRTDGTRRIVALPRAGEAHLGRMAPKSILGRRRRSDWFVGLLVVGILRDDHGSRLQRKSRKRGSPHPQPSAPTESAPAEKEGSVPSSLVAG
jgi:hypothetical protein